MDITPYSADLSVCAQIDPSDLQDLKTRGYRAIICNRPDGEAADQPGFAQIASAAQVAGLEARYIPVIPGQMGPLDVTAFAEAMQALPKPVLAYCRSGARSTTLADAALTQTEAQS
jgi:sulfide:quinone oxidoreductase